MPRTENRPPAEFEERAFRRCLPWYARLLAPVLRRMTPGFFDEDFKFIRYLGSATGGREVQAEVLSFQDVNRMKRIWLRTLGPKLKGKRHVVAGGYDDFFLNVGVDNLRAFLKTTDYGG
ncbi:MAG: hypothetical protein AB9869_24855 [Verrucomicrobiia bacterium]